MRDRELSDKHRKNKDISGNMQKIGKFPVSVIAVILLFHLMLCLGLVFLYRKAFRTPPEDFGEYLEALCREGYRSRLDQLVISRRLSLEEAAALADGSPLLEHLEGYTQDMPNINSRGIVVLTADVDGDGLEDVIEYGPGWDTEEANMLAVYLKNAEGGYRLACSQPLFPTNVLWTDIIEVVKYNKETYLLFMKRFQPNHITAWRLTAGTLREKLELTFQCSSVNAETVFCADGYDVDRLLHRSAEYYHTADYYHCSYGHGRWWRVMACGSAERKLDKEEWGIWKGTDSPFNRKYREMQQPYLQKYGDALLRIKSWGLTEVFESDINNNGIKEQYIKKLEELYFDGKGIPGLNLSIGPPFMTGEYFGSREGGMGLWYCIEESGQELDFLSMCGLDLWEGEMTPLFFCVEETGQGNVTCIIFRDRENFRQRVDGYLIQDETYEQVFSVSYTPEINCRIKYDHEPGESVDYIICLTKNGRGMELVWGNGEKAEQVNSRIRELLEKKVKEEFGDHGFSALRYRPICASEKTFLTECTLFYNDPSFLGFSDKNHVFYLQIDPDTGEGRELTQEERDTLAGALP